MKCSVNVLWVTMVFFVHLATTTFHLANVCPWFCLSANSVMKLTSARIGACEVVTPLLFQEVMADRPSNKPTNQQTDIKLHFRYLCFLRVSYLSLCHKVLRGVPSPETRTKLFLFFLSLPSWIVKPV